MSTDRMAMRELFKGRAGTPAQRSLALLVDHHAEVEQRCRTFVDEADAAQPSLLEMHWSHFESALLDHMVAEEELILPGYARDVPDDARTIRAGHTLLRLILGEVALEVQRGVVQRETIERLTRVLREHVEAEGSVMYAWAETHVVEPAGRTRFRRTWRLSTPKV